MIRVIYLLLLIDSHLFFSAHGMQFAGERIHVFNDEFLNIIWSQVSCLHHNLSSFLIVVHQSIVLLEPNKNCRWHYDLKLEDLSKLGEIENRSHSSFAWIIVIGEFSNPLLLFQFQIVLYC